MAPGLDITLLRQDNTTVIHLAGQPSKTPEFGITELSPTPPEINQDLPLQSTFVLNPTFITQEFDLLRFEAAASGQLPTGPNITTTPDLKSHTEEEERTNSASPAYSTLLISSPYNNPGHYLDLSVLPTPSLLFAKALTALKPTRPDYATAPYTEALNFPAVLAVLRDLARKQGVQWPSTSFYVVTFRSQLKDGIDNDWLYKLDYESHREACESGGLLKYWFGKSNGERRNLATCFWHSREDAYKGGLGPWHKKARAAGRELYEQIVFSTHRLTLLDGAEDYRFEDWSE
ncbi:uncharacterized protein K460DRAFT_392578 [Cucurbitaria berberidis CBS 394.84]|uniref:Uncharacterized protein n=1 Tax=Cucurbitaria berberidis CBS 394.84 TaxID=1168544 RepID=A0A9P4L9G1_9PLEO|nr:uncharacterized protein K460DRAFT_392578 [Cucurbitaria berberidis CBS 394.84]KAF1847146.1 hypothetical protein K460DRAFT_392578 [Cucurbitaria berberidis CBS 394.84]